MDSLKGVRFKEHQRALWRSSNPLLPLLLLLAVEVALALAVAVAIPTPLSATRLLTIGGMLVLSLVPAFLLPSPLSAGVGRLQVLIAALLWHSDTLVPELFFSQVGLAVFQPDPRVALSLVHAVLIIPATLHIVARFPRRSGLPDTFLGASYVVFGALAMLALLAPAPWRIVLLAVLAVGAYGGFTLAGWLLVEAIRDPRPAQQQQLVRARLLFVGLGLALGPVLALPIVRLLGGAIPPMLLAVVQICFPAAVLYAMLRRDLWRVDVALRRALGYATTSVGLLALYFGLTFALTTLLRGLAPTSPLITVVAVLGAASTFPWLQGQANRLITRIFYPERLGFQQELAAAREILGQVVRRDAVVALLTVELPARLGVEWARLQLLPEPPAVEGSAWSAPLLVGGRQLGIYWIGPRRTGLPFAPDEQEHLRGIAQQAALALAYAENYETLAALNAELEDRVAARTEQLMAHQRELATVAERQRLARDLHDSLKQTLFSLGLNLHAAAGLVQRDAERARTLIMQQAERAVQAQSELADLLSDLRATPIAPADLAAVVRHEAAQAEAQHGFSVAVTAPARLEVAEPVARELAAVVREALHNTLKHSGVDNARLNLQSDGDELFLCIADDGRGFDAGLVATGHGLRGMRERTASLGGTLTITTAKGEGTQLWVRIPQHSPSES
jgi:signal transduction histidine kinase